MRMKILAIIDVVAGARMDEVRASLVDELKGSWNLFSAGIVREAYATETPTRVVFVMEAASVEDAKAHLAPLPLVAAGHVRTEFVELMPFVNWQLLFR